MSGGGGMEMRGNWVIDSGRDNDILYVTGMWAKIRSLIRFAF